ncbi:hypothetical protein [uncultured Hyphomonas sp.]|uniref:hypothetical protein n=1 Tax=uncultured Hyphomonas sp. TaxID=225298 RepID=UPI002AAAF320|nr:hypothetical protein [uncultured Hyphomonas sp.]
MILASIPNAYETVEREFGHVVEDATRDFQVWYERLSDVERLMGLCGFILLLFFLVLSKSATRAADPGTGRSFAGSFTLVVVFSFVAGMLIDSPFDPRHFVNADMIRSFL